MQIRSIIASVVHRAFAPAERLAALSGGGRSVSRPRSGTRGPPASNVGWRNHRLSSLLHFAVPGVRLIGVSRVIERSPVRLQIVQGRTLHLLEGAGLDLAHSFR